MARLCALSFVLAWLEGRAEHATQITVSRKLLISESTGASSYNRLISTGQESSYEISASLSYQVQTSISVAEASASSELRSELSAAASSFQSRHETIRYNHPETPGHPYYVYQSELRVQTDQHTFTSTGAYEVSSHPLDPIREDVHVAAPEHSMRGERVEMLQPEEHRGWYDCRDKWANVCDEMSRNRGCRTVDDYTCNSGRRRGGQKPFKWGGDAYFSGWRLPEGLCVEPFRHWGRCNNGNSMGRRECGYGHSNDVNSMRVVRLWDRNDRICSWRFTLQRGYTCGPLGSIILVGNESVVDGADELGNISLAANASVLVSNTDGTDVLRGSRVSAPLPEAPLPDVVQSHKELAQMPSSALNTVQATAFIVCSLVMGVAFTLVVSKLRKTSADDYHQVDE